MMTRVVSQFLRPGVVVTALLLTLGACDDSTAGPEGEVYELETINGNALPGPYPDPMGCCTSFEVVAGELTLRSNGTLTQELTVRCKTCTVTGDGKESAEGTYSRTEAYVEYPGGPFGKSRFPADFADDAVTIHVGYPPSHGLFPSFDLVYRRR